jgi:hypothetical protein
LSTHQHPEILQSFGFSYTIMTRHGMLPKDAFDLTGYFIHIGHAVD